MDSNSKNPSFHERIIHSLFIKEKENIARRELDNYIYQNITKMSINNYNEFISNLLISFKNEIFDETKEYLKKIQKDINPILIIQNIIKVYTKNPKIFFILLNPLLDMYKTLEIKQIIEYTEKIINLLEDKNDIILTNFNELFEVVIYLIIRQEQSVKNVGEKLNVLLKKTLRKSIPKLDNKNIFDFDSFENKILEKTHINQPILDGFLLDWISEICNIENFYKNIGKLFYDLIPWVLKAKNNTIKDIANKAHDCDHELKNIFLNKYLNYYYKESQKINDCILSYIKLVKNKNVEDVSKEYTFLFDLIKKFILIVEENMDRNLNNNIFYENSTENSPVNKINYFKLKNNDNDIKKRHIIYSPTINYNPKRSRMIFENRNILKINNINSFDCLSQDSENKTNELSKLIPIDTLNDFMELIIQCNDISKEDQLNKLNTELKKLIEHIPNNYEKFNAKEFINTIIKGIENPDIINKEFLLDWYQLLCEKYEQKISDESILAIIKSVLKSIKNNQNEEKNTISKDNNIILLMFKKLEKLDIKKIFSLFSDCLNNSKDYSFISQIDAYLNNYLITSPRAEDLLNSFILYGKEKIPEQKPFYEKIYKIFAYNPMCLLLFSIITEYYELSWNLLLNFMKIKLDDDFYIYLIEFVQLLENSQSNHIRMLLLHPHDNIYLAKTLYGILMLLPQGKAFNILSDRLYSIKGLFKSMKEYYNGLEEKKNEDVDYFINIFLEIQKKKSKINIINK